VNFFQDNLAVDGGTEFLTVGSVIADADGQVNQQGKVMTLPKQVQFSQSEENPTIQRLLKFINPVSESTPTLDVLDIFQHNHDIYSIPVVDINNVPTGIVDRHSFVESFIKPYTREIYGKRRISDFMNRTPIIVDKETAIDDIAQIIIDAGMHHMVSGFIAVDRQQYIGIANGHDLLNEITQRKQANLFFLAHFDLLTKLPNRVLFMDRLNLAMIEAQRENTCVGLLFVDLDNFKNFNDSMGHGFGDNLLQGVAARLTSCAREYDTVARLSGDEFTILLENINSQNDLDNLCNRIIEVMSQPMQIMAREVFVTASIGVAMCPDDATDTTGLLAKADAAMYEAKRSGRNTYRHYVEGMNLYSDDHLSIETDLRMALERNEFELHYQPQVMLTNGNIVGNEALIRWRHPVRGLLSPIHFIEIAEETGLIVPIGRWVLETACRQQRLWVENGLESMCIAVNISAMQFHQANFCQEVRTIIAETGINPSSLELELTESLCMHDVEMVLLTLHELHDLGVKLAIDDFGTGYSNLSYLKRFPIDRLKIDQSFIRNMEREPVNVEIVKAITALGRSMSLELVAEGVETDSELDLAETSGCNFVQGYRFSSPLPADQLENWIKETQKSH
jgi:diguanylate cyclase (GGDEF)-like protein